MSLHTRHFRILKTDHTCSINTRVTASLLVTSRRAPASTLSLRVVPQQARKSPMLGTKGYATALQTFMNSYLTCRCIDKELCHC